MPEKEADSELIIIAPTQIKPHLSFGNLFDLTIADFYAKARRLTGVNVVLPFLLNVNGDPLIKQMLNLGITVTDENIHEFIDDCIHNIGEELNDHYLNFDFTIRDDQISEQLESLDNARYQGKFLVGKTLVNECKYCKKIFGSDPNILVCKNCGKNTQLTDRATVYIIINKIEIQSKIQNINFNPQSIKTQLHNFTNKLPNEYKLIIEKDRKYTPVFKGFKIDPRFTAIMLPAVIDAYKFDKRTWIHGDVIKKFDYYTLCYLNVDDCPTDIIAHKVLLGMDGKKIRWQNMEDETVELVKTLNNKILRAYFLQLNIYKDITLLPNEIEKIKKYLIKLYVKIQRTLEVRNLDKEKSGVRPELNELVVSFNLNIKNFRFQETFKNMSQYADLCWKIVKNDKISHEEYHTLKAYKTIFFGE